MYRQKLFLSKPFNTCQGYSGLNFDPIKKDWSQPAGRPQKQQKKRSRRWAKPLENTSQ
jgi:hypothetical protein